MDPRTGQPIPSTSAACREQPIIQRSKLLELPSDVLKSIIQHLDLESKVNLFETCKEIHKYAPTTPWSIRRGDATSSKLFQRRGFQHICEHLEELDLRGLHFKNFNLDRFDIYWMRMLRKLKRLDVSETDLPLEEIMIWCPNEVSHFTFSLSKDITGVFTSDRINGQVVLFFQRFTHITWKQNTYLYVCEPLLSLLLRTLTTVDEYKVTVKCNNTSLYYYKYRRQYWFKFKPRFRKITMCYVLLHCPQIIPKPLFEFDFIDLEFYIYNFDPQHRLITIVVSSLIYDVINQNRLKLRVNDNHVLRRNFIDLKDIQLIGHSTCLIWNKNRYSTRGFVKEVMDDLSELQPNHVCVHADETTEVVFNADNKDCYVHNVSSITSGEIELHSTGLADIFLNKKYNLTFMAGCICDLVNDHRSTDHVFIGNDLRNSSLENSNYLDNLTSLTLHDNRLNFDSRAWEELFSRCPNIKTLNISIFNMNTHQHIYISDHIHLCDKLKYFRLREPHFNYEYVFKGLSKCRELVVVSLDTVMPVTRKVCEDNRVGPNAVKNDQIWNLINSNYLSFIKECLNLKVLILNNFFETGVYQSYNENQMALLKFNGFHRRPDINVNASANELLDYAIYTEYADDVFYPNDRILVRPRTRVFI